MTHRILCCIAFIAVSLANAKTVVAQPNTITCVIQAFTETPNEGDLVEFTILIRNSGGLAADSAQLSIDWPLMGFLIDVSGLEQASIDETTRKISGAVSLSGGETIVRLSVLAPRHSAGNLLSVSVHLAHFPSGTELWEHKTIDIEARPSKGGIRLGAFRITEAGMAILAWLIAGLIIRLRLSHFYKRRTNFEARIDAAQARSRFRNRLTISNPNGITAALMIPLLFWTIFATMAWRDTRVLTAWTETKAIIVGRREIVRTDSDATRSRTSHRSGDGATSTPEFAFKYEVDGAPIYSTGYDTGSSLRWGGRVLNEREMANWNKGAVVTCWYDPDNPNDVVVRRGFGGAYLFALFPIPIFWIGISSLNQFLRSVSIKRETA